MNLYIAPINAAIFLLGCLAAYAVYRHNRASAGDLAVALTVGTTAVIMLCFLFGVDPAGGAAADRKPAPAASPESVRP
ncbi:hypothetical protein ACIF6I_35960 [Streptomyces microflavus]|uniref:hypothetical protein n=1 Tax=Streptomyces microflavus TaxID=1919 RepID=UPI0034453DE5